MKMKLLVRLSLVLFISIGLFGCNHYEEKDKIVIRGSTSVEPIMEILMDDYLKTVEGEKTQFDIKCEGSGKGREAAENDINGNVIGMSSSAIKKEDESKFSQFDLAKDAVVLIVNKENNLRNLTIEEVYDIYTGKTTKFDEMSENITVVARDSASGTREAFENVIVSSNSEKLAGKMIQTAEQLEKTAAVVAKVNTVKSAIGYVSLCSLDDSVIPLNINGVEATVDNVKNNSYVLYRPFVILTNATLTENNNLSKATINFINYLKSEKAKQIIENNNYISVD